MIDTEERLCKAETRELIERLCERTACANDNAWTMRGQC